MRLKVKQGGKGLHPNEMVIEIVSTTGIEKLLIDTRSIIEESIEIGSPLKILDEKFLIELPRETMNGAWRIWVDNTELLSNVKAA